MNAVAELPVPEWREEREDEYAVLAERLKPLVPCLEIPFHLPWIDAINYLRGAKTVAILCRLWDRQAGIRRLAW